LERDIRVASSRFVEVARKVGWDGLKEGCDGVGLVGRLGEDVGEPAAGEVDGDLYNENALVRLIVKKVKGTNRG
jgi:hypothetical protein